MNFWLAAIIAFVYYLVGFNLGGQAAHDTIAKECQRLGGFYVGSQTYICKIKDEE